MRQAALEAANRSDLVTEPEKLLRRCAASWTALHAALVACGAGEPPWAPADVRILFEGLCRWRGVRARGTIPSEEARRCHTLVVAALRLLLLDRFQELPREAKIALKTELAGWRSPLGAAELARLREFVPLGREETAAALEEAGSAWWATRPPAALAAQSAFAALFVRDVDDDSRALPELLLECMERLEGFEVEREALEDALEHRASPGQGEGARVAAWAASKAEVPFSDDARAAFVETLVRTRLNPVHAFSEGKERPSVALARVQPQRAVEVAAACARGVRLLGDHGAAAAAPPEDVDTLTVAVLDYYMDQRHGVAWASNYHAHHFAPGAALSRCARYLADRMVDPPPLVVRCLDAWYVAERSPRPGSFSRVLRFPRAAPALEHWLLWVRTQRRSTVAAGRTVERLLGEILDQVPAVEAVSLRAAPVFNT
jgi:hypothetical protein